MSGRVIALGEVMLRLTPPQGERFFQSPHLEPSFGGGESNTAAFLARMGLDVSFVTALPDNAIGDACIEFFRGHGVDTSLIRRQGERLGTYFVEFGAGQRPTRVVYDRAHSAIAEAAADHFDWEAVFAGAGWFHITGITPAISRSGADLALAAVRAAHARQVPISCDTSYRQKLWHYGKAPIEVMPGLAESVQMLFANEEDCDQTYGVRLAPEEAAGMDVAARNRRIGEKMFARFPNLRYLVFTHREGVGARQTRWGASVYNGEAYLTSARYPINHIVDRLGGGDALAAGLIYGLLTGMSDQQALDFGAAAACLKHSIARDINLVTRAEIEKLVVGDASGRVQR